MSKEKFARKIDFLVTETIDIKDANIVQTFQFWTSNKKYLKYAYDQRFCLRRKLEKLYEKELVKGFQFLSREESENKIVFRYDYDASGFFREPAKTFNCEFYLPPYNGCAFCLKAKAEGDFFFCEAKKKHYENLGIKSCPVFQSIEEIIS